MSNSQLSQQTALNVCVAALPESAATIRAALRAYLPTTALSVQRQYDVLIAIGEASSNAIEHAYRGQKGEVRLSVCIEGTCLRVEVRDGGTWRTDGDPERGRGLGIMRALMDTVEIVTTGSGTVVRLAMHFDPSESA